MQIHIFEAFVYVMSRQKLNRRNETCCPRQGGENCLEYPLTHEPVKVVVLHLQLSSGFVYFLVWFIY